MSSKTQQCDITCTTPALQQKTLLLAERFSLPVRASEKSQYAFSLVMTQDQLILQDNTAEKAHQTSIDFNDPQYQHRLKQQGWRQELLARAVGFKHNPTPTVIDATAGYGQDAFLLASLGASVTLIERSPVMAAMLAYAIERAQQAQCPAALRMQLIFGDACDIIPTLANDCDAITIDPMYPHSSKSALPKKRMQQLRHLIGHDEDASRCLSIARKGAKRVVVKRPKNAEPLANMKPSSVLRGSAARFDIYLG